MIIAMYDYIIVGAGISGLYAAYNLSKHNKSFLLLEKNSSLGGTWKSIKYKDSLFELGPNTIIDSSKDLQLLIEDLELESEVLKCPLKESKRYIFDGTELQELSSNPLSLLFSGLISTGGFLDFLFKFFSLTQSSKVKINDEEFQKGESVRDFAERNFGKEITRKLLETFLKGVWAGDPEKLSADYALKILAQMEKEHGSIFKALLSKFGKSKAKSKAKSIISFKEGLQSLCTAIVNKIAAENIALNSKVNKIELEADKYIVETSSGEETKSFQAKNIIFASKSFEVAELLGAIAPDLSEELNEIYYAPIALFAYSLPKSAFSKDLDGFGYLSAAEEFKTLGSIWASQLFPERNLDDEYVFLSCIGGAKNQEILELSEDCLWNQYIIPEQKRVYGKFLAKPLNDFDFKLLASKKITRAIPQLNIGHAEINSKIKSLLQNKYPNIHLLGNYMEGVAIKDALESVHTLDLETQDTFQEALTTA